MWSATVINIVCGGQLALFTLYLVRELHAPGSAIFSTGVVWFSTATRTYRFVSTPPELLSRVMATVRFVSWGGIPVGGVLAGLFADTFGLRAGLLALAVTTLGAPLALLAHQVRGLRDFPET